MISRHNRGRDGRGDEERMIKRAIRVAAAGFAATAAVAALPVPAQAACTDQVCVYQDWDGTGRVAGFTTADNNFSNNRYANSSVSVNDSASSASTTAGSPAYFYTDSYWRGFSYRVLNNGEAQNFAWDNAMSSFRFGAW
jgi:hypothetical protein